MASPRSPQQVKLIQELANEARRVAEMKNSPQLYDLADKLQSMSMGAKSPRTRSKSPARSPRTRSPSRKTKSPTRRSKSPSMMSEWM